VTEIIERVLVSEGSTLTVCDPCYLIDRSDPNDRLVYGHTEALPDHGPFALSAITEAPLHPGTWEVYAHEAVEGGWGPRIWHAGLRMVRPPAADDATTTEQGVDAGMVGFFVNRPRMTYNDTWTTDDGATTLELTRLFQKGHTFAWITDSGYGDGAYPVTAIWSQGRIIQVEATYIGFDGDDDNDGI
jgi:hypothetical protein